MRLGATAIASAGPTSPGERSASFRDGEHHYRCSPHFLFAGNTLMDRDSVVNDMARRVEELDQLLSRYMPPPPSDNPSESAADEAEFWAARLEERQQLQAALDTLLQATAA